MQDNTQHHVDQVILYRRKLAEIEARREKSGMEIPPETWQEFADVARYLEHAEGTVNQICNALVLEINQIHIRISSTLKEINELSGKMRQMEALFLANIVRPTEQLLLATRQRGYLEGEYRRIYKRIQQESYSCQGDLEADIHQVLAQKEQFSNSQYGIEDEDEEDDMLHESSLDWIDKFSVEDLEKAISMKDLEKEFKRVVFPKTHPDTSDTPNDVYLRIREVYEKRDAILMEAYIVEYRGDIKPEPDADVLDNLDQVLKSQKYTGNLLERLQGRLNRIQKEITIKELEEPDILQENLLRERYEVIAKIQVESVQILNWREKIEALLKVYLDLHNQGGL